MTEKYTTTGAGAPAHSDDRSLTAAVSRARQLVAPFVADRIRGVRLWRWLGYNMNDELPSYRHATPPRLHEELRHDFGGVAP
ncbi:hypothetical protein KO481_39575 [Nocardia sp. NEAU-G5]|uniref:Uncharacterized protein n=1 Tax=Nocardia albiluteola TaxID=2842303 RepID=A0ABS6BBE4_9NOCA|nr:hypothetical protein [Nocardia albiluteola]MBU3067608.1 hypothetical protein [Nocardia albiluteola]